MQRALTLYQTAIGKKAIMAVTGVILVGFVIAHLAGNLNAYAGPEAFNAYANSLREMPALLWGARIVLLVSFLAHVGTMAQLVRANRAARPSRYAMKKDVATTYAAKAMPWTGAALLFYVLFHLAHLTFGADLPGVAAFDPTNPYNNLVKGFQSEWLSAIYIVGNLCLGVHIYHGAWSMFQSLGASHPKYDRLRVDFAVAVATLLTLGNILFPIMVLLGKLEPTTQTFNFPHLH